MYIRSFADSNGDGIGDLQGLVSKLDYLAWLGVDLVWVSPFYPSPMADFGYDVSNYCDVDPIFGTLEDFDCLVAEVHRLGMRLLIDLVPNHSSSQHEWFVDSRSSMTVIRGVSITGGTLTNNLARLITGFLTLGFSMDI